jgi:hypothetical protein
MEPELPNRIDLREGRGEMEGEDWKENLLPAEGPLTLDLIEERRLSMDDADVTL